MNQRILSMAAVAVMAAGFSAFSAHAANIVVTNVSLSTRAGPGAAFVKFDVSWDASWRASWTESGTWTNWDAAWIFVKYRARDGADTNWHHAGLSTNDYDHSAPAGSAINVGLSTNAGGTNFGAGVFLFRSEEGSGSWTNSGVRLRWQYGADGVDAASRVDVSAHAIEMVYIPEGAYYLGSGGGSSNGAPVTNELNAFYQYTDGSQSTNPFPVSSTNAITVGTAAGNLYYPTNNAYAGDRLGPISNSFPNGYAAFYCMKYEISQGQYATFLNYLTAQQSANLYPSNYGSYRHTITNISGVYTASAPDRACNYLSWMDGCAYADWAGLRPMTELEFEKTCRGPLYPVTNEYAWGSTNITRQTGHVGTDGSGTETASPTNANCNYSSGISGPVRCGIYAVTNAGREKAGAGYYGVMELSGNLWERPVTVGGTQGRTFRGTTGDGVLSTNGWANNSDWPGYSAGQVTGASGAGRRVGGWNHVTTYLRISDRYSTADANTGRSSTSGWRGGRSAP